MMHSWGSLGVYIISHIMAQSSDQVGVSSMTAGVQYDGRCLGGVQYDGRCLGGVRYGRCPVWWQVSERCPVWRQVSVRCPVWRQVSGMMGGVRYDGRCPVWREVSGRCPVWRQVSSQHRLVRHLVDPRVKHIVQNYRRGRYQFKPESSITYC